MLNSTNLLRRTIRAIRRWWVHPRCRSTASGEIVYAPVQATARPNWLRWSRVCATRWWARADQRPGYDKRQPAAVTAVGQSSHVPEDRHAYGMVDTYSIADNLVLNTYYLSPFSRRATINEKAIREHSEELVQQFDVRTPSVTTAAGSLSGGNQQKMVVAREFSRPIKLLIAAQPTRGIDVGSIEFIHNQIVAKRDEDVAVLVVSSELDEIMALSDRIAVMYKGEIIDVVPRAATREGLGLLMAGVKN
ncbi:MAG: hypothetical protein IPK16_10805 [Anaerolineales bacterium]|nr:hypothetical protein [Anaerolineales bacterium]